MSSLSCTICACVCIIIGLLFLLHSLFAPRWISACVSLASAVLDQKDVGNQAGSHSKLHHKPESPIFPPLGTGSLLLDQQLLKEKIWLFENLNSKQICLSEGFYGYCMFGEGLMRFGNYHICVDNEVRENQWDKTESLTVSALILSAGGSILSLFLLLVALRVQWCRGNIKWVSVICHCSAIVLFASGTMVLVGLLPIAAQSISYSSNPTNFYNDMVNRLGPAYLFELKVNWSVRDGDLTVAQTWARNIVRNITDLGLDRDFFIALSAGIFLYSACASLLLLIRSNHHEQTEKYHGSLLGNQKQS